MSVEKLSRHVTLLKPEEVRLLPCNRAAQGCQAQGLELQVFVEALFSIGQAAPIPGHLKPKHDVLDCAGCMLCCAVASPASWTGLPLTGGTATLHRPPVSGQVCLSQGAPPRYIDRLHEAREFWPEAPELEALFGEEHIVSP
jgi:hypothetical protein